MASKRTESETPRIAKHICVTQLQCKEQRGSLIWKIRGFSNCRNRANAKVKLLESPNFRVSGSDTNWKVKLSSVKDDISLSLQASTSEKIRFTVQFSTIDISGEKGNIKNVVGFYSRPVQVRNFLSWNSLMRVKDYLLPNNQLTISCELTITSENQEVVCDYDTEYRDSNLENGDLNRDLEEFLDKKLSTDVVLKLGESEIFAHKLILACRSPVFASMFEHDMLERNTNEVAITDVDSDVFRALVRYMYTDAVLYGELDFTLKLLVAADKYDVKSLKARCVRDLCEKISEKNVFDILIVSDACSTKELTEKCMLVVVDVISQGLQLDWVSKLSANPQVWSIIQRLLNYQKSDTNCGSWSFFPFV